MIVELTAGTDIKRGQHIACAHKTGHIVPFGSPNSYPFDLSWARKETIAASDTYSVDGRLKVKIYMAWEKLR